MSGGVVYNFAWNDAANKFYGYVIADDSEHVFQSEPSWFDNGDMLEVRFDADQSGGDTGWPNQGDYQYASIGYDGAGGWWSNVGLKGDQVEDIGMDWEVAITVDGSLITYEFGLAPYEFFAFYEGGVDSILDLETNDHVSISLQYVTKNFSGAAGILTSGPHHWKNASTWSDIELVGPAEMVITGDMDCDGDVDFDDIDDFVLGLNNPAIYENMFGVPASLKGDTDGDMDLDFDDISGFVDLLSGGGLQAAVPEPMSVSLFGLGMICLAAFVWRRR